MKKKLFINGMIYTMDKNMPVIENVVINDNKIIAVNANIRKEQFNNYEIIDLAGKVLLPGFNDSHMHLLSYGKSLDMVDLNSTRSIEELKYKVKDFIERNNIPDGKWVLGRGWNHEKFKEKRMPNRYDLDEISERHPIVLTRTCGHIRVLNTRCMEISGLNENFQIESGKIFKDENGNPLGIFAEQGTKAIIYKNKPKLTRGEIKKYILLAADEFRKSGLTSVHTDDFEAEAQNENYQEILDAYYELSDEGMLPIKVNHKLQLKKVKDIDTLLKNNVKRNYSDYLSIGPLKIEADGCLGGWTAAIENQYEDKPNDAGILNFEYSELYELIDYAYRNNLQVACHAIGDRTAKIYLKIIEIMKNKYNKDLRPRLIHCQITNMDLIRKMASLGVIADVQPIFVGTDWQIVERRVGRRRAMTSYAWRSLMEQGVIVAGGSDTPVERYEPLLGIKCAVERKDESGKPKGGWNPFEKVTVYDALKMYTYNSAYAEFKEDRKGVIKEGFEADFVILEEDPYLVEPNALGDIPVYGTVVNGNIRI